MNLESQVTSLELSQKLKSLNVNQESYFYWIAPDRIITINDFGNDEEEISAFTVSELLEMLPKEIDSKDKYHPHCLNMEWILHYSDNMTWNITYKNYNKKIHQLDFMIYGDKMTDALAKLMIHLIENKYLNVYENHWEYAAAIQNKLAKMEK